MISKLCYELYKIDWKRSHMITSEIEMDAIKNHYQLCADECDKTYSFNDYISEHGYSGEIYACYEEFLETEYKDIQYICRLLDNDDLIEEYKKELNKIEYEVSIVVNARFYTSVKASSPEEAKEKASAIFEEADIGELECVDWNVQHAEGDDDSWTDF